MGKGEKLEETLYYLIEKTNKVARRYSQLRFSANNIDLTVDQWLVLKKISDSKTLTQIELATALFKDRASITRILDLLLNKKLVRKDQGVDKRVYHLSLTPSGENLRERALRIVKDARKKGVEGLSDKEQLTLRSTLQQMIENFE